MNKYLKKFNDIITDLETENKGYGYDMLSKILIADEFNNYYGQNANLILTPEQEEIMIEIIHNFYLETDGDINYFTCTNAICDTFRNYTSFEAFYDDYKASPNKFYSNISIEN